MFFNYSIILNYLNDHFCEILNLTYIPIRRENTRIRNTVCALLFKFVFDNRERTFLKLHNALKKKKK